MIVTTSRHGPFERISIAARVGDRDIQFSVYRAGELLVDAGSARGAAALVDALRDDPPRAIVLTHHHEDHAGGVAALRRAFGHVPVHAPAPHVSYLREEHDLRAYRVAAWGLPPPIPDVLPFTPGAAFAAGGGVTLDAVATPGHTPGHVAFVARVGEVAYALTGDLYVGARPFTAWYESAADDLVRSWRALAARPVQLLPTHGRAREDGERALRDVADLVERAAEQVEETAARLGTREPGAIAREAFGPEPAFSAVTRGEFCYAAFVRSVLDPVRALPASPIRLG